MAVSHPGAFGRLDDTDKDVIVVGLLEASPTKTLTTEELERDVPIIASWMFQAIVDATLLDMLRTGKVRASVKDGEINIEMVKE